jgi:hemerythrin superfamily protein
MPRTTSMPGNAIPGRVMPLAMNQGRRRSARPVDAIALLKADHRQVRSWFAQYRRAAGEHRKLELATSICTALKVHALIEEEIFYPAFFDATGEREMHHAATVEHEMASRLIADIEASNPADEFFDAKVQVLGELIRHHVNEEERPGGLFARARQSSLDLRALGEQLRDRKQQFEGQVSTAPAPGRRGRNGILGRILEVASR